MQTSCLFLKPEIITPQDREKQEQDIKRILIPAIAQARLSPIDDQIGGIVVSDISDDLVQKACKADILIIDANWYEITDVFQLSPYLYYYMAIGHSRGNATILVTNTTTHLPHNLVKYHTLTYASVYSSAEIWSFTYRFVHVVNGIQEQQNRQPDNPIQDYFSRKKLAEVRRRRAEREAEMALQRQGKLRPFKFYPVEEDWE
jgi:hypothetical protein